MLRWFSTWAMARLRDSWPPTLTASTQKGNPPCPSHLLGNRMTGKHAAETQMVQPGRLRTKTSFNIAQALASGQLRVRQAQILIKALKALDLASTTVTGHAR